MRSGGAGFAAAACAAAAILVLGACAGSKGVPTRAVFPELRTGDWSVTSNPATDLWYHGLAVIGLGSDAPLPLYSADYAEDVRAEKREAGRYPTALDLQAEAFLNGFGSDAAFEVLHFAPLFFQTVDEIDRVLESVVRSGGRPGRIGVGRLDFAAQYLAANLPARRQRELLGRWRDALMQEWDDFYRESRDARRPEVEARLRSVESRWDSTFGPKLEPLLTYLMLDQGTVILVPALGPEGRSLPVDRRTNFVAVSWDPERDPSDAALHRVVREICFGFSADVVQRLATTDDDGSAESGGSRTERLVAYAAVRAGEIVLRKIAEDLAPGYRRTWLRETVAGADATLAATYPLPDTLVAALEHRIDFFLAGL